MPANSLSQSANPKHFSHSGISAGSTRLALGTVQFGLSYGVANTQGKVGYKDAETMLGMARDAGIDTLDTAIAYGQAESVLGCIGVTGFRLISKVPALSEPVECVDGWVEFQVESSLTRLQINQLSGLMLHAPDDLLGPYGEKIVRGLLRVKESGLVDRIGLSVYSPEQLSALINLLPIEILQIPFNIFDRRFAESGWLHKLAQQGVEVHARSAFLQGLLLMPSERVPSKFIPFRPLINNWHAWLVNQAEDRSPVEACLGHVASYADIARIVVGADNPAQLQQIITAANLTPCQAPPSLASPVCSLINPAEWSKL